MLGAPAMSKPSLGFLRSTEWSMRMIPLWSLLVKKIDPPPVRPPCP